MPWAIPNRTINISLGRELHGFIRDVRTTHTIPRDRKTVAVRMETSEKALVRVEKIYRASPARDFQGRKNTTLGKSR